MAEASILPGAAHEGPRMTAVTRLAGRVLSPGGRVAGHVALGGRVLAVEGRRAGAPPPPEAEED